MYVCIYCMYCMYTDIRYTSAGVSLSFARYGLDLLVTGHRHDQELWSPNRWPNGRFFPWGKPEDTGGKLLKTRETLRKPWENPGKMWENHGKLWDNSGKAWMMQLMNNRADF